MHFHCLLSQCCSPRAWGNSWHFHGFSLRKPKPPTALLSAALLSLIVLNSCPHFASLRVSKAIFLCIIWHKKKIKHTFNFSLFERLSHAPRWDNSSCIIGNAEVHCILVSGMDASTIWHRGLSTESLKSCVCSSWRNRNMFPNCTWREKSNLIPGYECVCYLSRTFLTEEFPKLLFPAGVHDVLNSKQLPKNEHQNIMTDKLITPQVLKKPTNYLKLIAVKFPSPCIKVIVGVFRCGVVWLTYR